MENMVHTFPQIEVLEKTVPKFTWRRRTAAGWGCLAYVGRCAVRTGACAVVGGAERNGGRRIFMHGGPSWLRAGEFLFSVVQSLRPLADRANAG